MTPGVLLLQAAAIAASLFHVLIDVTIDLYGPAAGSAGSLTLTAAQALTLLSFALIYGWWPSACAAATAGIRGAMLALAMLAFVWAFLVNGVVGLVACFPPCGNAFPWQDASHLASAVFGGWAALAAWRAFYGKIGPVQAAPAVTAVVLMLFSFAMQAVAFRP